MKKKKNDQADVETAISFGVAIQLILEKVKTMDKKIKALEKKTKNLVKDEKKLLKADKKQDKIVAKAKMKMKGKC